MNKTLNDLRDEVHATSKSHGFHDKPQSIGDACALIHSEVSELLEDHRDGLLPKTVQYRDPETKVLRVDFVSPVDGSLRKPCGIPSECADIIIRVLDFCALHGIDIDDAVREKMMFNETRPKMHGKVM